MKALQPDVKRQRRRTATKRNRIVDYFRGRIISGILPPGAPLPTHEEVRLKFKTGSVTVQKSFDILAEQGFVSTIPGHLSVVSEKLPHSHRIGVVIPGSNELMKNRFFLSVLHMVEKGLEPSPYEFVPYLVNILRNDMENDDAEKLLDDVSSRSLKGVIWASYPSLDDVQMRMISEKCPSVRLSTEKIPGIPCLTVDHYGSFFEEAIRLAKLAGGRRIALFLNSTTTEQHMKEILKLIADNGLQTRKDWIHGINILEPKWAGNLACLLFSQDKSDRPDTLFVMDDNLVEAVSGGLSGIEGLSSADLTVIAHANYPEIVPSLFPAMRVGFDVSEILQKGAEMIDRLSLNPKMKIAESVKAVHLPQNNIFKADASGGTRNIPLKQNILMQMGGR